MDSRFNELISALGDKAPVLRDLFDAATDLPATARDAWIENNVTDVDLRSALRELLAADVEKGVLDTPAEQLHERIAPQDLTPEGLLGQQVGGFRLIRTLGQGGMAVVFLGERVGRDFAQRAAIKLLRRGLYSELEQRLFLRERRVLASLEHPNIARLIDGGVTNAGIPYLILEYVDGQSITHYSDARRLDVAQRLTLFLSVCSAVEAAHRALIVHRDIKPSNILVTAAGEVKLLDFGIAKLIEDENDATGTVGVFTRDYAAPEQVRGGAITTATDVYGLGVLLYELLLGKKPDIADEVAGLRRPSSLVEAAAEGGAAPPAHTAEQLRRLLRGDLDNIVIKALESDPSRRYPTAGAFGDDIARHLSGRPVLAHPPTRWYRARKFIQRHRGGVTITAALVVTVIAALSLSLWQANIARHERDRANSVVDFLLRVFSAAAPGVADAKAPTLRDLVADGQVALAADSRLDDDARMEIATRLVDVQRSIGDLSSARTQARKLLDRAEKKYGAGAEPTLLAARASGEVDIDRGDYAAAIDTVNRFIDRQHGRHTTQSARLLALGAEAESKMEHESDAIADAKTAIAWCAEAHCAGQEQIDVNETVAVVEDKAGNYVEAEPAYRQALALKRAAYGDEHAEIASTLLGISGSQMKAGHFVEAEKTAQEGIAVAEKVYIRPHNSLAAHYQNLGILYFRQERFEEASRAWRRTLDIQTAVLPTGHRDLETTLSNLGVLEMARENFAAAVPMLQRAAASAKARNEAGAADFAITARSLATSLTNSGSFDEGRQTIDQSIAIRTRLFGADDARTLGSRTALAAILIAHGDEAGALAECDGILQSYADSGSKDEDAIAQVGIYKGEALLKLSRRDDALALLLSSAGKLSDRPVALRARARALLDVAENTPSTDSTEYADIRAQAASTIAKLNFKPPSLTTRLAKLRTD